MTGDLRVIGVDPGPTPGVVLIEVSAQNTQPLLRLEVLQCSAGLLVDVVERLLKRTDAERVHDRPPQLAVEQFVVGNRAGRSSTPAAGRVAREQIAQLIDLAHEHGTDVLLSLRAAAAVKPWATDERLEAAGLLEACKGMRHARDAARHALFSAVRDGGLPDPLSTTDHAHTLWRTA